ncbi:Acetyl-coenzyme A carboxyl transferase alpha chain [Salmonella enterica subsp. enterica serovar Minnesota str. A4-603]|nr:Acetyl-coenzyme A carboxyl transferase alpha chain [Salmonella enterica subsp. enterica serovar Minnesota str. A4-603]
MSLNFLDFEQPIAELEAKIDSLTAVSRQDEKLDINIDEEVHRLREKSVELTRKIFADLGAWQVAQLARRAIRSVRTHTGAPSAASVHPGLCPSGV